MRKNDEKWSTAWKISNTLQTKSTKTTQPKFVSLYFQTYSYRCVLVILLFVCLRHTFLSSHPLQPPYYPTIHQQLMRVRIMHSYSSILHVRICNTLWLYVWMVLSVVLIPYMFLRDCTIKDFSQPTTQPTTYSILYSHSGVCILQFTTTSSQPYSITHTVTSCSYSTKSSISTFDFIPPHSLSTASLPLSSRVEWFYRAFHSIPFDRHDSHSDQQSS